MRLGKASQAVMDRSVIRPLKRSGWYDPAAVWDMSMQVDTLGGVFDPTTEMLLAGAVNDYLTKHMAWEDMILSVGLMIPADMPEEALKAVIDEVGAFAKKTSIRISGGHTQISDAVQRIVMSVSVSSAGSVSAVVPVQKEPAGDFQPRRELCVPKPGWQLLMTGYAGWAGTSVLARAGKAQLTKRFPAVFVEEAVSFGKELLLKDVCAAAEGKTAVMHDVSRGGVFGSLWEVALQYGVGLDVDLRAIPIRQETIEICEFFDLNPYQLYGCGSALIAADPACDMAGTLLQAGIPCTLIGEITKGPGKILRNGEEIRYLDKPAQDMLALMVERNRI